MKTIITILIAIIAVMSYFMISMYVTLENKTLELQNEYRSSWEMDKACNGHRMYLMNILDEYGIQYMK